MGTPDYIAPEILRYAEQIAEESNDFESSCWRESEQERAYGKEVDLWSCGVVVYEVSSNSYLIVLRPNVGSKLRNDRRGHSAVVRKGPLLCGGDFRNLRKNHQFSSESRRRPSFRSHWWATDTDAHSHAGL